MKIRVATALALAGTAFVVAGCSTTPPAGGGALAGDGVTADVIRVGLLTDLSGPFAANAGTQVTELKAFWDKVNQTGGICGRSVELDVRDHGLDPQRAVSLYRSMAPDVIAFQQIFGSAVLPATLPLAEQDGRYVGFGWSAKELDNSVVQMPGATYSIESANGIDHLVDSGAVTAGDTVGVLYMIGDYGSDSLAGVEYAAGAHNLKVISREVTPQKTDLAAEVSAFKEAGVSAIVVATPPTQLGALAGALTTQQVDVPILGNSPSFSSTLLQGPAAPMLTENFRLLHSVAPFADDADEVRSATALYESVAPDGYKGWEVPLAYGYGLLLKTALENACTSGQLTPEGVTNGIRQTTALDTHGLFASTLDYSTEGEPPTRAVFLSAPDAQVPGGDRKSVV